LRGLILVGRKTKSKPLRLTMRKRVAFRSRDVHAVDGRERHGLWAEFAERLKSFCAQLTACYTHGTLMYCPSDVITHAISLTPAAAAAAIIHANVGDNPSPLSAGIVAFVVIHENHLYAS